jgi:integrase
VKAAELERRACRKAEGMIDPYEEHLRRPVAEHVADYRCELESRGNAAPYVDDTIAQLLAIVKGGEFRFIADFCASSVMDWLQSLRRPRVRPAPLEVGKEWFTVIEACKMLGMKRATIATFVRRNQLAARDDADKGRMYARGTLETIQERKAGGVSMRTANGYLVSLKSFCNWMVKDRRMHDHPFTHLSCGNVDTDRRHDRRELTADELPRLLQAARKSERTLFGLAGEDRFMPYATACGTGFRASALASLTPADFDLDASVPTVTLSARHAKNRKMKVQPLPTDVADLLRDYLRTRSARSIIWGGTWARHHKGAEVVRHDLEAADIPYVVEGPDGPLYADFHALRHSYLTLLGRGGVDLRTVQELAGHSTPALTARYSHRRLFDLAGAVQMLPKFLHGETPNMEPQSLPMTGTDGTPAHVVLHVGLSDMPTHSDASRCIGGVSEKGKLDRRNHLKEKPLGIDLRQEASDSIRVDDRTRTGDSQIHNLEL